MGRLIRPFLLSWIQMAQQNRFRNHYACPCGTPWTDEWPATCDDRCPTCGTSCAPHSSDDIVEPHPPSARDRRERFTWRDVDIEIHNPGERPGNHDTNKTN